MKVDNYFYLFLYERKELMAKSRYCSECGEKMQSNEKYCSKCGTKVNKINNFIDVKAFLLALLVVGTLIFLMMRKDIINCIIPTTSVNLNSLGILEQYDFEDIDSFGRLEVMIPVVVVIAVISEWTLYKKYTSNYWTIFRKILNLVGGIVFAISITCLSEKSNVYDFLLVAVTFLLVLVIIGLSLYHTIVDEEGIKSKLGPIFWRKVRGITVATLTVFVILDGFVMFETNILGKPNYVQKIEQNRNVKGRKAVSQIRQIFSNCKLTLNGEDAINYQGCTMHIVREDNTPLIFDDNTNKYTFCIYMDKDDEFQYYPDVIADDNAQGVIGNTKDNCMYLDMYMANSGKLIIKIDPVDGKSHSYELENNDGIPSLDGILEVCGCAPAQASFTLAS